MISEFPFFESYDKHILMCNLFVCPSNQKPLMLKPLKNIYISEVQGGNSTSYSKWVWPGHKLVPCAEAAARVTSIVRATRIGMQSEN